MNSDIRLGISFTKVICCKLCSGPLKMRVAAEDPVTNFGVFQVLWCKWCEIGFTCPTVSSAQVHLLYEGRDTPDFAESSRLVSRLRRLRLRQIGVSLLESRVNESVDSEFVALDFGCGDGSLAVELSRIGKFSKVVATDFHFEPPMLVRNSSGVEYLSMDEFLARKYECQFDIIVIRHVLEHHLQPRELVELVATLLKPNGQALVEVPSFDGLWPKIFKGNYYGWYVPRHLTHFTAKSLAGLFDDRFKTSIRKSHVPLLGMSIGAAINREISNLGLFGVALFPLQILGDTLVGGSSSLLLDVKRLQQ